MRYIKFFILYLSFFTIAYCTLTATAHSGGTDSNGGHYDRQSGDYHFHHGYPAHEHPDGQCPYYSDIKENEDYHSNSGFKDIDIISFLVGIGLLSCFAFLIQSFITILILQKYSVLIDFFSKSFLTKIWISSIIISIQFAIILDYFSDTWAWSTMLVTESIFQTIIITPINKKVKYYKTFEGLSYLQIFNKVNQTNINCKFDTNFLPIGDNKDLGIYGEYTCYVTESGKCKHFKYNCCKATKPKHIFETTQYSTCSKCEKNKNTILISETQYANFLSVIKDLKAIKINIIEK